MHYELLANYYDLSIETKQYLEKAMDIFNTIEDKEIKKEVEILPGLREIIELDKVDKKCMSLFLAAFLVEGILRDLILKSEHIKLSSFYDFLDLEKESDSDNPKLVKPDSQYINLYNNWFREPLIFLNDCKKKDFDIYEITPETLYTLLNIPYLQQLSILYQFGKYQNSKFDKYPSFQFVLDDCIENGLMKRKAKKFQRSNSLLDKQNNNINKPLSSLFKNLDIDYIVDEKPEEQLQLDEDKIWGILDGVQKKFIGQEKVAEQLFYNIINNQELAKQDHINDGERSIIFLDGPTGTGKTAITREITEQLDIPFTSTSVINYSSTGYVGGDITDTLKKLYERANGNLEKAQRGIIVFDEFDKLASDSNRGLVMKTAVQQQLLDFMGGGKYEINVGPNFLYSKKITFDTSKLTFICLGALSNLRQDKQHVDNAVGFGQALGDNIMEYSITPQDLVDLGLERELVGRFNTYIHTEEYSKDDLLRILKESSISPLISLKKLVESKGKQLVISDDVYVEIARCAYELNTGARSLQTVMNSIRTTILKELYRGENKEIVITAQLVEQINNNTTTRKVRK